MNENLNLVEILKDCPKGTKLYSTAFGDVYFYGISDNKEYPIGIAVAGNSDYRTLTYDGKLWRDYGGECILFPSKDQRDWSKFKLKQYRLAPIHEFKDGDILSYQCKCFKNRTIYIYRHRERFNTGYYVALSGDNDKELMIDNKGVWALNGYNDTARFATEEEKQKLFKAIKDNGYEWNADTKTLKKLVKPKPKFKVGDKIVNRFCIYRGNIGRKCVISEITEDKYILNDGGYIHIKDQDIWELVPNKFDPKTLRPFDKVLVRRGNENYDVWFPEFVITPPDDTINKTLCMCIMEDILMVIPYNDDTKHLVGTSDKAPEHYRYWED